jgi:hypothetical protein
MPRSVRHIGTVSGRVLACCAFAALLARLTATPRFHLRQSRYAQT